MIPQRIAAMIASGITAINIALSGLVYPAVSYGTDAVIDPLHMYTDQYDQRYEDWLDMSEIKIDRNVTTIDGVSYDNVWLSNEAAEKFRTAAGDFKTAYSIASNTNGTYATGKGQIFGIDAYYVNGEIKTPTYTFSDYGTYQVGELECTVEPWTSNFPYYLSVKRNNQNIVGVTAKANQLPFTMYCKGTQAGDILVPGGGSVYLHGSSYVNGTQANGTVPNPFDFDYTSGLIPVDPLPSDYGINYRVPSTVINNVYNNYYGSDQTQWPDFSVPVQIDVDTADGAMLAVMIADLIADTIDALRTDSNITINYAPQPDTPIPPEPDVPQPAPDVDPDTPVSDVTYEEYYQTITNQTTFMTESIDNIDQSIQNVIENQDQQIQNQETIINDSIPEIIENIPKIDDICNNIDTAPYHDLDTGLDHLPSVFLPFITDLRSALGIWHYVTEWIGQISNTFTFVTGCLVGTSIMTPIYAAIAGFMCIKVYRRMTG